MIIWLNGAFGSGKSTIGTLLQQKLTPSFIYDPEIIGGSLTANLPESMQLSDFQDYPEWRQWNLHLLKKIASQFQGVVIVPMTLYQKAYFDEIMTGLAMSGLEVHHFQLEVDKTLIGERLKRREDGTFNWGMSKVDEILAFFETLPLEQKIVNQDRSLAEVVDEIIARLS